MGVGGFVWKYDGWGGVDCVIRWVVVGLKGVGFCRILSGLGF